MRRTCVSALLLGMMQLTVTAAAEKTPELPLLLHEDFAKGAERWQPTDAAAWKVADAKQGKMYSQFAQSKYTPPHRSPFNFSLIKDVKVSDFVLEAKVQSTGKDG